MNSLGQKIVGNSLVEVWVRYVLFVFNGTISSDDGQPIREQFGVVLHFTPDADFEAVHPLMNMALQTQYVKKVLSTEIDKKLGGSYGYRIRCTYGIDQFEVMVEQLIKRPNSKSACCNLLHPRDWEEEAGMKRMACLTYIQALIRDGQLHFFAQFRSQNAWNSHGNFKGLYELQRLMLSRLEERGLKVKRGGLRVDIVAAHLYEPDFKGAEQISKEVGVY